MSVTTGPARAAARPRPAPRPVPVPQPEFAHLDLPALRAYRTQLGQEENRVSYWRRIVQARLDLLRAGQDGSGLDHLREVLGGHSGGGSRLALVTLGPVDDVPPLPDLPGLWDRLADPRDGAPSPELVDALERAEAELSEYRSALHRRLGEATQELVARYREQPSLALEILPLGPPRRARA